MKLDFDEYYSDSTLQAYIKRIAPTKWEKISQSLVIYAKDVGLEAGRVVSIDATAIESDVHEPMDSSLLFDCIRSANAQFETLRSQHRYPKQVVTDRGFASEDNLFDAKELGIKDVCFTKSLGLEVEDMVKSRWVFEKLRNFRAGIESVISCLKRGFALDRVTWKGVRGYGAYVHSAVVAYNLVRTAKLSEA